MLMDSVFMNLGSVGLKKSDMSMKVSREGYLEVAAELNCKDNVYSHCLRVNTYFALAIVEYFSGADVAILMA
ncbi:hypothetical protein Tco_0719961 [Tanacetum coccineum]